MNFAESYIAALSEEARLNSIRDQIDQHAVRIAELKEAISIKEESQALLCRNGVSIGDRAEDERKELDQIRIKLGELAVSLTKKPQQMPGLD